MTDYMIEICRYNKIETLYAVMLPDNHRAIGVVIASAVIPTFIAQKWFMPVHSEDMVDLNNGNGK